MRSGLAVPGTDRESALIRTVLKNRTVDDHFDPVLMIVAMLSMLYFHVTTVYAVLRHNGVEIGKRDFIGNP